MIKKIRRKKKKKSLHTFNLKFFSNMKCPAEEFLQIIEYCEICKPSEMVVPDHSVQLLAQEKWLGARPKRILHQHASHATVALQGVVLYCTS